MAVHHLLVLSAKNFQPIFIELFSLRGKTQGVKPYIEVCKASFGSTRNEEHVLTLLRSGYSLSLPTQQRSLSSSLCAVWYALEYCIYIVTADSLKSETRRDGNC
jgi:hypothetical protein